MRDFSRSLWLVVAALLMDAYGPGSALAQPASVVFAGSEHQAVGASSLVLDPTRSVLTIDGLGASGGVSYQLDAEAGSIRFGDGIRGQRPSSGGWSVHATYRNGGGASGEVQGSVNALGPTVIFDHGPVGTNSVTGTVMRGGQVVVQFDFSPSVILNVDEWPSEVELGVDEGEMRTAARWETLVIVFLPDGTAVDADHVVFTSQTGGALAGEELGVMVFEGSGLGPVQLLGERFRADGLWFEVGGNALLRRDLIDHELTHVVQDGTAGTYVEFAPTPCFDFDPDEPNRMRVGLQTESLATRSPPVDGTRVDHLVYASLGQQTVSRIPTHTKEWTNPQNADPGMTLLGGFVELGAVSWTVQVFDDGIVVDRESGLGAEVARVKGFVGQHDQVDLDFLDQRAAAQIDLGVDQEVTILASVPRTVMGDRVHIIPEQLQLYPECVEAVGVQIRKVPDVTLKRGVIGAALPDARTSGIKLKPLGDVVVIGPPSEVQVANEAWGPNPGGALAGAARVLMAGLEGIRWELAGDIDPASAPQGSQRSFRVGTRDVTGQVGSAGLDVVAQTGLFSIAHDLDDLGSTSADVTAFLNGEEVYTGVLLQQGRVLVDSDFDEASAYQTPDGLFAFDLAWDTPQALLIGGQPVIADRISERLRHRDRGVTVWDYEHVVLGTSGTTIHRASVRPRGAWWSAVGNVEFAAFTENPVLVDLLVPSVPSGVEVESQDDPQGNAFVQLVMPDPGQYDPLSGDEVFRLEVQEVDEAAPQKAMAFPLSTLTLDRDLSRWSALADFAAAGYTRFRVLAGGVGEVHVSTSATGEAFISTDWPETWTVKGVADGLWIDLGYPAQTQIEVPGGSLFATSRVTVIAEGAQRPPFGSGLARFLFEGQSTAAILLTEVTAAVGPEDGTVPRLERSVVLHPARPNPFNPGTELRFELKAAGHVEMSIHDPAGRRVRTLLREQRGAGHHRCVWDGRDDLGSSVASGVYFVRLESSSGNAQQKIALIK